ncbi:NADPH-dependent 2,4-dienoyl-CoA reductase, sulfur reductase [Bhargavaea ginsengi]|uniref:NADPH-dependent 2,4-dienoyl-CoA reductase, sulfur reductase n=1 Tax=Bhargavaea ginsengi TaxID=426757 RepID=A0A1H7AHX5_9BACL|nr:CoA-disulfide reductase [Bhargavaea ginsengi]SEJ61520.1 NADPH-dependent 2,4-dienoyl-CoA reductase, sulfur reductase [Bhargavaea ginsengi]
MKIVVIGAVAGGATVSSQIRHFLSDADITLIGKDSELGFGTCGMPYVLGGLIDSEEDLVHATPEGFSEKKSIDVRLLHEATKIDRATKKVHICNLETGQTDELPYDKLVLSPGGRARKPAVPGKPDIPMFTLRHFGDLGQFKSFLDEQKPASCLVIGGGFIGVELAENFRHRGIETALVEHNDHVMPIGDEDMSDLLAEEMERNGVRLHLGRELKMIDGRRITLDDGTELEADFIATAVGLEPNTLLAKEAGIEIGPTGGIATDPFMRTNDPDIYAIGDAAEVKDWFTGKPKRVPLSWPAHRAAFIVANHLAGGDTEMDGMLGTSITKLFSLTAGMTGMTEKMLKKEGMAYKTVIHKSRSNAGYYPDSGKLVLKVHYDPDTRAIYGAQAVGEKGADKRIDVIATAIRGGLTVDDLSAIETAYAPPYGSPKDPVNMLGYRAMRS